MTGSTFRLGGVFDVNRLGFGAMRLTGQPGNFGRYRDWDAGIALLRRAAALGVNFFDSAWAYGPETADQLLGEALSDLPVVFATKGGVDKTAPGKPVVDGSRDTLLRQIDKTLVNLRRETIDLYQLHHVDPNTPLEVSVEALAEARDDGRIRLVGLSNCTRAHVERAAKIVPVASVQNRLNMAERADTDLVRHTAEAGIAYIPYAPLGADSQIHGARLEPRDALRWLLDLSPNIVVIPSTTSMAHLEENCSADACTRHH